MGRVTSTPPPTRMVAVLKSAPTLPDNNTATHMVVAVLLAGSRCTRQKPSKNRFRAVYRPFSTVFRIAVTRESPEESGTRPFFPRRAPSKNGETGENGPISDSDPTHIALAAISNGVLLSGL